MLHLFRRRHRRRLIVSFLWPLLLAGCGGGRGDLAPVKGNVKLDGQPLADAQVQFAPQEGTGVVALGRTDKDGNYEMMATRTAMGASRGVNQVRITTFEIEDHEGKQKVIRERVPTRYNSASELRVTVNAGRNTFDFELSSAGGKVEKMSESPARIQ